MNDRDERIVGDRVDTHDTVVERNTGSRWSPAQIVALVIGLSFLVLGAVALARAGFGAWFTHTDVAGLHHTQVLALIHLGAGVLMTASGVVRGGARGLMGLLGAVALGFGVILLLQPDGLHEWLGTHQAHGFLYIVVGLVALVAGIVAQMMGGERTHVSRETHRW